MTNTVLKTMDQSRIEFALTTINAWQKDTEAHSEYKSYLASLPAFIHMNGLVQALTFYKAKKNTHEKIYTAIESWLCKSTAGRVYENQNDLLEAIAEGDMFAYMAAQQETQALLVWLKKMALAKLDN